MGADLSDRRPGRFGHRTTRPRQQGAAAKAASQRSGRRSAGRGSAPARRGRLPKKSASLGVGRGATPTQKTPAVQKLRRRHSLEILLSIAQLPRATFYYHLKRMNCADKYESAESGLSRRKTEPEMGHRCDRIPFIRRKTLFISRSGSAQQRSGQLYYL